MQKDKEERERESEVKGGECMNKIIDSNEFMKNKKRDSFFLLLFISLIKMTTTTTKLIFIYQYNNHNAYIYHTRTHIRT